MKRRLVKFICEADPVNCTVPEKLPEGPVGEVELATPMFLQTPKGAPACKNQIQFT